MRNAAATFDDDHGYDTPVRKSAPRKSRASSPKPKSRKKKGRRFAVDMHKVARYAAIGMSATVVAGIMVNALVMQKGHHPAPLFGKGTLGISAAPVTPVKDTRVAVVDPAPKADEPMGVAAPPPMPVVKPRPATPKPTASDQAPKASGEDQIAKLLKTGVAPVVASDRSDTKTVLGAQKALAKLGFALKANGTMGPATKKAIEAFEKERNMPVNGELTHRVVKILGAESGVKID